MLRNIGMTELIVILGICLLLFGNRLGNVGKSLGEGIRFFKKGLREDEAENATDPAKPGPGALPPGSPKSEADLKVPGNTHARS